MKFGHFRRNFGQAESRARDAEAREREAEQSVVAIREASAERLHALSEAADAAKAEADSLAAAKAEADALAAAERVAHERSETELNQMVAEAQTRAREAEENADTLRSEGPAEPFSYAAAAQQGGAEALKLDAVAAAAVAEVRRLVTGLNHEAVRLVNARPPKHELALARLQEAKKVVETEGLRLALESQAGSGEAGEGGTPQSASYDELCFLTYYNLGRLCSRALFRPAAVVGRGSAGHRRRSVADRGLQRDAEEGGVFAGPKGQLLPTDSWAMRRWRLAEKWLRKALSHSPPEELHNLEMLLGAHAEFAMVQMALGNVALDAEYHADRVIQLGTLHLRELKSSSLVRAGAKALATQLKEAAGVLETAKLEFHARRVHDLVKQASSMAAGRWVSTDTKRELDGGRAKQDASGLSSTRRRRKHKAEAQSFATDAFVNRLAGPLASSKMILNGQIHRGVQFAPMRSRGASKRRGRRHSRGAAKTSAAAKRGGKGAPALPDDGQQKQLQQLVGELNELVVEARPPWSPAGELNAERRRQRIEKRRQRSRPASAPSNAGGNRRKEKALDEAVDLERSRNISRSRRREAAGALQSDLAPLLSDAGLPPQTGLVSMEQYLALEGRCKALEASLSSLSVSTTGSELAQ